MRKISACLLCGLLSLYIGASVSAGQTAVELKARSFTPGPGTVALDLARAEGIEARHFFVQLDRFADASVRAELEAEGVRLLEYIPQHTWIASFERRAIENQNLAARFLWVGEILPTDKMRARWLNGEFGNWAIQPDGRIEMRVRFHKDVDVEATGADLESIDAELVAPFSIFKGYTILGTEEMVPLLAEMDAAAWITEGLPVPAINNDQNRFMSRAEQLQAPPYNLGGFGVLIGVWDGGLPDVDHEDFFGRIFLGESGDMTSHATHVAGTLAGSGILSEINGGTPLQWRGMAPEAGLLCYDYFGDLAQEITDAIEIYDLDLETNSWNWAVDSLNCDLYGDYDWMAPEFDEIMTDPTIKTISIVFSASNERDDGDCTLIEGQYGCIPPPSTAKNVITVGATNSDDDTMTAFSSWGPVDDGRLKPELTAPGCEHYGEEGVHSCKPGDTYDVKCGTSMAAPTVTGNLALLHQLYNEEHGGADPEPSMMKALLIATADDLGNPGPDYAFGHGRINAKKAADALLNDSQATLEIDHGETHELLFPIPAGYPNLRVVLVWNDPPASPLADPTLINNLDLFLIAPNAGLHRPWILDPASPSLDATRGPDSLHNVEHAEIENPIPGTWRARIIGTNIPEGPQRFSLAGFDAKAPGSPIDLTAADSTFTSLQLTWTNAPDGDRKGTMIARWEGSTTWDGPIDGDTYTADTQVYPGAWIIYIADEDHSETPFADAELDSATTYTYAAYTFDDVHNYSDPTIALGTTMDPAGVVQIGSGEATLTLGPARPNPAFSEVRFSFGLPRRVHTTIRLYDPAGRLVRTLLDGVMDAGTYAVRWDGRDEVGRQVATGVYFYELNAGGKRLSRQVSWMR